MLNFAQCGDRKNPTVVLLHGLGIDHRMWTPQLADLSEDHFVLAPDLPGFTPKVPGELASLAATSRSVADWLEQTFPSSVYLCGLSLGGMVALQLAHDYPHLVKGLIVSGAQVRPPPLLMFVQSFILRFMPEKIFLKGTDAPYMTETLKKAEQETAMFLGKQSFLRVMREAGKVNLRPLLPAIHQPSLILCGAKDKPNLPVAKELAAKLPQAELRIVPGVGHVWNLEAPEKFSDEVRHFVATVEKTPAKVEEHPFFGSRVSDKSVEEIVDELRRPRYPDV